MQPARVRTSGLSRPRYVEMTSVRELKVAKRIYYNNNNN